MHVFRGRVCLWGDLLAAKPEVDFLYHPLLKSFLFVTFYQFPVVSCNFIFWLLIPFNPLMTQMNAAEKQMTSSEIFGICGI